MPGENVYQIDGNVAFRPRPDGHPWVAGGELEGGTVREQRDPIVGVEEMAGVVGRRQAGDASADDEKMFGTVGGEAQRR
jgi:hypothetical protein